VIVTLSRIKEAGVVLVLFRRLLRDDADLGQYEATFGKMFGLVSQMPGFLGIEDFVAADGRTHLAVARFESEADVDEWRMNAEHRKAQQRGRNEFYESYELEVATLVRQRSFEREPSTT
jgi:heme-degrading monooxygenase HmoA